MSLIVEVFLPEDIGSVLNMMSRNAGGMGRGTPRGQGHTGVAQANRRPFQKGPKVEGDPKKFGEFGEAYAAPKALYILMKVQGGYATWYVNDSNDKFEAIGNPVDIKTREDALNVMRIHHDEIASGIRK